MIYCIGNSHAAIFSATAPCSDKTPPANRGLCAVNPDHPGMRAFFLGPTLAYNLRETKGMDKVKECVGLANRANDTIVLYMGDIDCRYQIAKKVMENAGTMEAVVSETVARYVEVITWVVRDGWDLVVLGVHPTTLAGHNPDVNTPHWGDCAFRNSICVMWNEKVRAATEKLGAKYVSIFDLLVDENNLTRMEYFVDYCHLSYDKCFPLLLDRMRAAGVRGA